MGSVGTTSVSVSYVRRLLFVVGVSLALTFSAFFVFVVSSRKYRRDYQLDEKVFRHAVQIAVSNVLDRQVALFSELRDLVATNKVSGKMQEMPIVEYCDSWAYWVDFRSGRPCCRIDGCDYTLGDYSQYGLCVDISDRACYFRAPDSRMVVVRWKRRDSEPGERAAPTRARPALEPGDSSYTL